MWSILLINCEIPPRARIRLSYGHRISVCETSIIKDIQCTCVLCTCIKLYIWTISHARVKQSANNNLWVESRPRLIADWESLGAPDVNRAQTRLSVGFPIANWFYSFRRSWSNLCKRCRMTAFQPSTHSLHRFCYFSWEATAEQQPRLIAEFVSISTRVN